MSKTNKNNSPLDKSKKILEDDCRVLQNGLYGYIYKGKAILQSADYNEVNTFSKTVKSVISMKMDKKDTNHAILTTAKELQAKQPLFIQNELPNPTAEKVHGKTNNHEAQIKVPSF